jgi:hypothetical protein
MPLAAPDLTRNDSLCHELEKVLASHFGATRRIRSLRRRQSRYASSCPIHNLWIELETGESLSIVLKDLSPSSLLEAARKVRPGGIYNPRREMDMYRMALDSEHFGTALCCGTLIREDTSSFWLLLERVTGPLLWQVGRIGQWRSAARWLAHFHSHFAKDIKHKAPPGVLVHDARHYLRWLERAERFACGHHNGVSAASARFKRIAKAYRSVVKYLLALPSTLIHGEFYPSNVIVRRRNENQICPIDWEVAALGPGLIDVAALVSGKWSEDARTSMITAYREELELRTGVAPSLRELLEAVDYCQLYLSVQWLGWAADWSPPVDHEQNWFEEAARLSDRLGS